MKHLTLLTFVFSILLFNISIAQNNFTYIGVEGCVMCHKTEKQGSQLSIWQNSKHAKAYETLKTEKANQIAKEKGFTTPAVETEECLKCHATGYNLDKAILGKKFKIEDGVQCETCHGPGSAYKDMKIMKDRALSIQNGLVYHEEKEKFCINCHNVESPTYTGFEFEEYWNQIKHLVPKK
ncbi:cytochrome c family protein [Ignavibacterium sp.]|uniref:cytochrome c family protein n=1 Tax=Ignavibacterium sp. TaxID=2651167 RepID=UPI00307F3D47